MLVITAGVLLMTRLGYIRNVLKKHLFRDDVFEALEILDK
jgi:hypothetical protein